MKCKDNSTFKLSHLEISDCEQKYLSVDNDAQKNTSKLRAGIVAVSNQKIDASEFDV